MRIIIKNANFSVYGLTDISGLVSTLVSNYGGLTNANKASVETFLRALGADGSNSIWPKIRHLYMPCLAVSTDADANSLYDIITGGSYPKSNPSTTVVIEDKKGVEPAVMAGGGEGIGYYSLTEDALTDNTMSFFVSYTRALGHDLQNSSGIQTQLGSIVFKWENTVMNIAVIGGSNNCTIEKPEGFATPNWVVMTAKDNGSRTVVSADGETTTSILTSDNTTYFNLANGYCCTSICGVCAGLTAAEARIISAAIGEFVSGFGILNTV